MRLLLLTLAMPLALASPLPSFNEIEKRWAEGHSEVCASSASLPGCYFEAWITSLSNMWQSQQIHTGLTHRDMTPAWPMHARDSEDGSGFATATDERSIEASVLRARGASLMEQMRGFVERYMKSQGMSGVIARTEEDAAPVLKPRKTMRYHFTERDQ